MIDKRIKTPGVINIVGTFFLVLFLFYSIFEGDFYIFYDPLILIILFIVLLLLIILNIIDNFILRQEIKFLPKSDKLNVITYLNLNFIQKIYKYLFYYYHKDYQAKYLPHEYDGIKELDNKTPIWWINIFSFTVLFSAIYFISYLLTDFSNPYKEYKLAYNQHINSINLYDKNKPQVNINTAKFNKNYIQQGKMIFEQVCVTCHNVGGGGGSGPNLIDNYWININSNKLFDNIFYIVWNGSKNNRIMRAFGLTGELKGNDIEKVSSYIYNINKNKLHVSNEKAPQGIFYNKWID